MPRRSKSKSKPKSKAKAQPTGNKKSRSSKRLVRYETPPSSPIPPITTLNPDLDYGEPSLNLGFPLSCARDEPGTNPMLEIFVFVPMPPPPTPTRGKMSRQSKKSRKPAAKTKSSSTFQVVEKQRKKRTKIQVEKSSRVLRPKGGQRLVKPEEKLDGSTTDQSALRLSKGKKNNERLGGSVG
ncbi:hypothetical protein BYT27DRAFT_7282486 [Phlegmacium glaucopus]|nr:hypothetical protein BYT27DRAFT_7282486 [Phlegmacium glaucopus]